MAKSQSNSKDAWDRVYRDVKESREQNRSLPDPQQYEGLTKSTGSKE
jgi:hypothetical protein